jgi:dihydroxyacetone kinase DhaKLM complex PTS-EIIA-like component DhaM
MLTLTDITRIIEQELQEVVSNINKADSIIIFVDAGSVLIAVYL